MNVIVCWNDKANLYEEFIAYFPVLPRIGDTISLERMDIDESNPLYEFDELKVYEVVFYADNDVVSIKCTTRCESHNPEP